MISLAAAYLFSSVLRPIDDTVTITASEDVWVYPNASDPGADETFKVWGVGGRSVAEKPGEAESFGYGYLKFEVPTLPEGKKLVSAWMILKPAASMKIDKNAKDYPLEVHSLVGTFSEKSWTYDMSSKVYPDKFIYGRGVVAQAEGSTDPNNLVIAVDLNDNKTDSFKTALTKAVADKTSLYFALASKYDASEGGREGIYRIYTKDRKEGDSKPKIVLKFE